MNKENIKKAELYITIILVSIATWISFNKKILIFIAFLVMRMSFAWVLYKKNIYDEKAKKEFCFDLVWNGFFLLLCIIYVFMRSTML